MYHTNVEQKVTCFNITPRLYLFLCPSFFFLSSLKAQVKAVGTGAIIRRMCPNARVTGTALHEQTAQQGQYAGSVTQQERQVSARTARETVHPFVQQCGTFTPCVEGTGGVAGALARSTGHEKARHGKNISADKRQAATIQGVVYAMPLSRRWKNHAEYASACLPAGNFAHQLPAGHYAVSRTRQVFWAVE